MAIFILYKPIGYNYIKKSHKLHCIFFLRMTRVMNNESNTHTGVSVVEVAGCCKDCGRDSSDWVLTNPLPWPFTVSPLVTGGCCWVKAAFNLWNANAIKKKKRSLCYIQFNSQSTLCLTQRQCLPRNTKYIGLSIAFIYFISLDYSKHQHDNLRFGKLLRCAIWYNCRTLYFVYLFLRRPKKWKYSIWT